MSFAYLLSRTQDSDDFPFIRAERRRLRDWLRTNIPVQWGKRVLQIEQDDQGVSVHFEGGGSAKGDILVGADGVNSVGKSVITNSRSWKSAVTAELGWRLTICSNQSENTL